MIEKRKERQNLPRENLDALEGGDDVTFKDEWEVLRVHNVEWQEEWNREPKSTDQEEFLPKEYSRKILLDAGVIERSFLSLIGFFEAIARQQIPASQGNLPTKIYRMIVRRLDLETYRACMNVSALFRDLCQQEVRLTDDVVFLETNVQTEGNASRDPSMVITTIQAVGDYREDVVLSEKPYSYFDPPTDNDYQVVVGSQRNQRTILPDMEISWKSVEPLLRS